jgi:hypothetical protein
MPHAYIQAVFTDDPGLEEPALTRERLKDRFPKGATRRMTQLGLLIGSVLERLGPGPEDLLVYASEYAETRALEGYLDSFPTASPTLFQTSIHPSAVQQLMIQRQQPVRTFFPMTGRAHLVAQALQVALLGGAPRALLCGGEERGTWLLDHKAASDRTFAFALALTPEASGAVARLSLERRPGGEGTLTLGRLFDALHQRAPLACAPAPGLWLQLDWT